MSVRKLALMSLAFAASLATASARAHDVKAGDLVISQAWARAQGHGYHRAVQASDEVRRVETMVT